MAERVILTYRLSWAFAIVVRKVKNAVQAVVQAYEITKENLAVALYLITMFKRKLVGKLR